MEIGEIPGEASIIEFHNAREAHQGDEEKHRSGVVGFPLPGSRVCRGSSGKPNLRFNLNHVKARVSLTKHAGGCKAGVVPCLRSTRRADPEDYEPTSKASCSKVQAWCE